MTDSTQPTPEGPGAASRALELALNRALALQRPVVLAHIARIQRRRPEITAAALVRELEKHYLAAVTTVGAASGGAAAVPGVTTGPAIALSLAEIGTFLEATVLFTLAVAEVHQVEIQDTDRRRTLLLAVILGNSGTALVEKAAGRTGAQWGRLLTKAIPMEQIRAVNRVLGRNFVTKYGTKQGILVIGRAAPFGIGAGIGAIGNAALGYGSVRAARRAFGELDGAIQHVG